MMDFKLGEWIWGMWQLACNTHGTKKKNWVSDKIGWYYLPSTQGLFHLESCLESKAMWKVQIWHFWHVTYFSVLFPSVRWYLVGQEGRHSSHLIQLNFSLCIKMLLYSTNSEYTRVFQVIICCDPILFFHFTDARF